MNKGGGGTQKDHVMGTWGVGVWFWSKFVHVVYLQPLSTNEFGLITFYQPKLLLKLIGPTGSFLVLPEPEIVLGIYK